MPEEDPPAESSAGSSREPGRSRASAVIPQALTLVLAAGAGGLAAWGLGSSTAWIALPLIGTTVPLWPRLVRSIGGRASHAVARPTTEWGTSRLDPPMRWGALVIPGIICVALLALMVRTGAPTLAHLIGLVVSLACAIGVWAWQFCAPGTLGRRIGASAVAWSLGLCGNWAASAADCASAKALVARVSDAAFAGARAGAREGIRDALDDPATQEALARRIAERLISGASGLELIDGPRADAAGATIASAVLRAKAAADSGDRAAADALAAAEEGRTGELLAFLGGEASDAPPDGTDDLIEMHLEIAAVAELAGDSRTALESYEQVLRRRPDDADTLTRAAALALGAGGRTLEAKAMYERARDASSRPETQFWAIIGLGDIAERIVTLAEASRQFRLALQIATRMSEREPESADWKRNVSVAHTRIAGVQAAQGMGEAAVASHTASNTIKAALAAADPGNTTAKRDLAIGYAALAHVYTDRGQTAEASVCIYKSYEIRKSLAESDPTNTLWKRDLASIMQDLGNVREAAGDFASALGSYQEASAILDELCSIDRANTSWARDLSIAHNNIADVLLLMDSAGESLSAAQNAMAIARRLTSQEPANAQWQRDLAMCHYRIGDARLAMEEIPGALEAFGAGLAIVERLAATDGANMQWKRDAFVGHDRIGDARSRSDLHGAIASYESALSVADAMAALDPENPTYQRDRASSLRSIGLANGALGEYTEALEATTAEHALRVEIVGRDPANLARRRELGLSVYTLAIILVDLGRLDDARSRAGEAAHILGEVSAAAPANAEWRRDAEAAEALVKQLGP